MLAAPPTDHVLRFQRAMVLCTALIAMLTVDIWLYWSKGTREATEERGETFSVGVVVAPRGVARRARKFISMSILSISCASQSCGPRSRALLPGGPSAHPRL